MRATLEFSLPEEKHELETAMKASEMLSALLEMDNILRTCLKHGGDPARAMQSCRETISETIHGLQ